MAKIVITHFSGICIQGRFVATVFYEGLIQSLLAEGHSVLHIITNNFISRPWNGSNDVFSENLQIQTLKKIKDFEPDLIISFNNSSIKGIEDAVNCPIALWEADSFRFFNDKKVIRKNADRYHYFAFASDAINDYKRELGISNNQVSRIPVATAIKNLSEKKLYNVSFIGNTFATDASFGSLASAPELRKINPQHLNEKEIVRLASKYSHISNNVEELLLRSSGQKRLSLAYNLLDEGIKLFGPDSWYKLAMLDDRIFDSYDPRNVYSLDHNQKIYNRSKISLNTNHWQATTGFAWRAVDILASDSVLLTESSSDLQKLCENRLELQTFNSPREAKDAVKTLLQCKSRREDLIHQQNTLADENFRWHHRFPLMAQLTGVDLSPSSKPGLYSELQIQEPDSSKCSFLMLQAYKFAHNRKLGILNSPLFVNYSVKFLSKYAPNTYRSISYMRNTKPKEINSKIQASNDYN